MKIGNLDKVVRHHKRPCAEVKRQSESERAFTISLMIYTEQSTPNGAMGRLAAESCAPVPQTGFWGLTDRTSKTGRTCIFF